MKNILALLFLLPTSIIHPQNATKDIQVDYKVYNNTDLPNTFFSVLYCHDNKTIYFEKYSGQNFNQNAQEEENTTIVKPQFVFEPFTQFDYKKNKIYLFETISNNIFYVEDAFIKPNWILTQETKELAGYKCVKATTSFRGRTWIAWFAPEIAVPYGPWQLNGLPGLIIETYDESNTYVMQMYKITLTTNDLFSKEFSNLYDAKNVKPLSYKDFVTQYEEYLKNTRASIDRENKSMQRMEIPLRSGKELKYEWEE